MGEPPYIPDLVAISEALTAPAMFVDSKQVFENTQLFERALMGHIFTADGVNRHRTFLSTYIGHPWLSPSERLYLVECGELFGLEGGDRAAFQLPPFLRDPTRFGPGLETLNKQDRNKECFNDDFRCGMVRSHLGPAFTAAMQALEETCICGSFVSQHQKERVLQQLGVLKGDVRKDKFKSFWVDSEGDSTEFENMWNSHLTCIQMVQDRWAHIGTSESQTHPREAARFFSSRGLTIPGSVELLQVIDECRAELIEQLGNSSDDLPQELMAVDDPHVFVHLVKRQVLDLLGHGDDSIDKYPHEFDVAVGASSQQGGVMHLPQDTQWIQSVEGKASMALILAQELTHIIQSKWIHSPQVCHTFYASEAWANAFELCFGKLIGLEYSSVKSALKKLSYLDGAVAFHMAGCTREAVGERLGSYPLWPAEEIPERLKLVIDGPGLRPLRNGGPYVVGMAAVLRAFEASGSDPDFFKKECKAHGLLENPHVVANDFDVDDLLRSIHPTIIALRT
ncbi:hypothetical protein IPG41_04065 [Candidatus Peregrinibacteria bacterium]|nr:MAG: hypothetical protein IPG41_04065 [Candidatus Peregrinibacteria bacterium]